MPTPEQLSRNALLVKFFAQAYPRIPRTNLVKYIYLADVHAWEYLGHPISTLNYRRDRHAPYDPAIEDAVEELIASGHADEKREGWFSWRGGGEYVLLIDHGRPVAFDFTRGEAAVLDYVVRVYLSMNFKELLRDVVYQTPPMKADVPRKRPLPMERLANTGTKRVGFRLDDVLKGEDECGRGELISLSAFADELRAKAPA